MYDEVAADEAAAQGRQRVLQFREVILYQQHQAYPQYVVRFKRSPVEVSRSFKPLAEYVATLGPW